MMNLYGDNIEFCIYSGYLQLFPIFEKSNSCIGYMMQDISLNLYKFSTGL